jgi:alpha-amylase/alpha-mannosidase (GH57 family)
MSLPLRIAILWHQHQPYYRVKDEFALPWVRLHAVKDYTDLPLIHTEFPSLKLTYNIVPSLLIQLDEYSKGVLDTVQRLTYIQAERLTLDDKQSILQLFFLCNHNTMLYPYDRYRELYEQSRDADFALHHWTTQEWLDLQVWYNLTWIGELSRRNSAIQSLLHKSRGFTENDKQIVLLHHRLLLRSMNPLLTELQSSSMAELSVTPLYHPILPLIIDTNSALSATPDITLPEKGYSQPSSASVHLRRGVEVFEQHLSSRPHGIWCSEGSVSNQTLDLLTEYSFTWTATDEAVLFNTITNTQGAEFHHTDKYFPYKVRTTSGKDVTIFFRDHELSDAIGFVYSQWDTNSAVNDFVGRLHGIRNNLIEKYGEDILLNAVVPIILDGENCWEYYKQNGVPFLRGIYEKLTTDSTLSTVTFSDILESNTEYRRLDSGITSGSWIFGNFKIWIGHEEKNTAWTELSKARDMYEENKNTMNEQSSHEAHEHLLIAEGSDWFWWYGDDHSAESRTVFDDIFRYHLRSVYTLCNVDIPNRLFQSIMKNNYTSGGMSAMHRVSTS